MVTKTLAEIIDMFAWVHRETYGDYTRAWGRCDAATYAFITFAREHGYECHAYTFYATEAEHKLFGGATDQPNPDPDTYSVFDDAGNTLLNDAGERMCTWHCIVDAGHILIDFTARQYRKHYAYPHIVAVEEKAFAAKAGA
jgi:hypothetical protein